MVNIAAETKKLKENQGKKANVNSEWNIYSRLYFRNIVNYPIYLQIK